MRISNLLASALCVWGCFLFTGCDSDNDSDNGTSPTTSATLTTREWRDVAYATQSQAQKLDIFLPATGNGPFPVIVSIHGGAFMMGDKADGQESAAKEGLNRGYAVISINYRLSGEAIWPAQIYDVKAAIRWIKANASPYALNANKIAVWGGSAGAHLSAMIGTSAGVSALEDASLGNASQSTKVQAVVDWFGPINFLTMDAQFAASGIAGETHNTPMSPESKLMGQLITEIPDKVQAASPATYITSDDPAFFIQHGTADTKIPTQQSVDFAAALQAAIGSGNVTFEALPGAEHGDPMFSTATNTAKVFDFLDKYLK